MSFVKPVGIENEHPGYTSEPNGSDHLVDLIQAVMTRPAGRQHADRGHLRRVRRAVGSRPAARQANNGLRTTSGAQAPAFRLC